MKRAIKNRIKILNLRLPLISKVKLFILACISPFLNKIKLSIPVTNIKLGKSSIVITDYVDLGTFFEVFLHDEYKIPKSINKEINRVLDLGANSGYVSIYIADLFRNAQIIGVEADVSNVNKIRRNIDSYNDRILVEPSAIAGKSGTVDFYRNWNTSISSSMIMREMNAEKISVPAISLSDLEIKYGHFDIIKFDIEGGEWDSLYPDVLAYKPTLWIGEYHEDLTGKSVEEFISRFTDYLIDSRKIANNRFLLTITKKI